MPQIRLIVRDVFLEKRKIGSDFIMIELTGGQKQSEAPLLPAGVE